MSHFDIFGDYINIKLIINYSMSIDKVLEESLKQATLCLDLGQEGDRELKEMIDKIIDKLK